VPRDPIDFEELIVCVLTNRSSGRVLGKVPSSCTGVRAAHMNAFRNSLSQRLRELAVEERAWPGREDGFASLLFDGKEFAHFHNWCEIDIRLGKDTIKRERLRHPSDSKVHPGRSKNSPWYEMPILSAADVNEVVRLVEIAILGLGSGK
jgi:hypothetical protein